MRRRHLHSSTVYSAYGQQQRYSREDARGRPDRDSGNSYRRRGRDEDRSQWQRSAPWQERSGSGERPSRRTHAPTPSRGGWQQDGRQDRRPPAPRPSDASSGFLAEDRTFRQLGLGEEAAAALANAGFQRPSKVQAVTIPAMLSGQHVVIAAETGSGKTLSYLAPLMSAMLARRAAAAPADASIPAARVAKWNDVALVLCPNAALCQQVVAVTDSLLGDDGQPLVAAVQLSSSTPPPHNRAVDIAVTTPGALQTMLHGGWLGAEWSRAGLARRIRHVVLDEADLLLSGGFLEPTTKLLELLRLDERGVRRGQAAFQMGTSPAAVDALPYQLRAAASSGGAEALAQAGYKGAQSELRPLHPASGNALGMPNDDHAWNDAPEDLRHQCDWRRQYAFVGATMPSEGKKNVASDLKAKFPDAVWLAGDALHQPQAAIQHAWRPVTAADWLSELEAAVATPAQDGGRGRTLVFARDVTAADEVADFLREVGVPALSYHKRVPADDRAAALDTLAREEGAVVVATDAAARGLDIPRVAHVVQADFAASAIDFLHRVGRTARAGQAGRVTSLYSEESAPLANAIREAIEAGEPIEGAFSRNRSFRKKLKRYGRYVPRGQTG